MTRIRIIIPAATVEQIKLYLVRGAALLLCVLISPLAAHASPFDSGISSIQTLFTGTIAKAASLIAIVIGGYPLALKFDYAFKTNEEPFDIQSIYHDDKFTYIKTNAPEKFSVYEMRDGKPNLINYELRDGTYIIPKVMDNGYVELGKKKMDFTRKG